MKLMKVMKRMQNLKRTNPKVNILVEKGEDVSQAELVEEDTFT